MVSINYAFKEIISKIVYYGPGLSGKTTNLQYVFKKVPQDTRGELISLATDADRTLYFDFLPVNVGTIQGFATKFQLYTVPGQVYYNATRKLVLRGVDGLVFVADSQNEKMDENVESIQNLKDNLEEYGYDIKQIPMVIQYNKRDLPNIVSIEELQRILNPMGIPYHEAVASTGEGVFKTLKAISKMVLDQVRSKRMEPGRIAPKPEPVAVGAASKQVQSAPVMPEPAPQIVKPSAPKAEAVRAAAMQTLVEEKISVPQSTEMGIPIHEIEDNDEPSAPPAIVSEAEVHTTVVVSDNPEKQNGEQTAQKKDDLEETTERSILKDESPSSEIQPEVAAETKSIKKSKYVLDDIPDDVLYGKKAQKENFDEEATQISEIVIKNPLPLGKPQMAESRKIRAKKGKFSLFKWLKKSDDEEE